MEAFKANGDRSDERCKWRRRKERREVVDLVSAGEKEGGGRGGVKGVRVGL